MDQHRKSSLRSYASNASSRSGSFDFDHDQDKERAGLTGDGDRREVVVKIDPEPHSPVSLHAPGGVSGHSSAVSTPRAGGAVSILAPSASGSSASTSSAGGDASRSGDSFSFKNRPPQSPASGESSEDPPSRLIGNFLRKQAAVGGELSIDPDFDVDEMRRPPRAPTSSNASRELRVSFQDPRKRFSPSTSTASSSSYDAGDNRNQSNIDLDTAEVLRCTSTSTGSSLLARSKTRSRLMDPPPPSTSSAPAGEGDPRKSFVSKGLPPKSGQLRSGLVGKSGLIGKSGPIGKSGGFDDEDDDPFVDEGMTSDFKRDTMDCLLIMEWVSLVVIVGALICSVTVPRLSRKKLSGLHLWKWELLVLVLICGRLVSGWLIRIAVFFVERNFLLRKKVLYFVYGVRRAVRNVLWLGIALVSWHLLFDKDAKRETHTLVLTYVTKVLCCLLVATVIRLVKTLLLKVLASSFHVSTYFDRIQEALFNQYVIETLSGPPLVDESRMMAEVQRLQSAGASIPSELEATAMPGKSGPLPKSGRLTTVASKRGGGGGTSKQLHRQKTELHLDDGISIDQLHRLSQKNISAWSMKRLMKIVRYGALTTMDEQLKHATGEDELATEIHSEYEAKVAAKRIFQNVAKPGSK
jgi:hypothetical protein